MNSASENRQDAVQSSDNITKQEVNRGIPATRPKKSALIILLLWFFLGVLGVHRMYIGKVGTGVTMLILTILGWLTAIFYIGIVFLIIVFIWYWVDLVLMILYINKNDY